jgi:predicted ATPase/class 3 adenylate cyclase
LDELEKWLTPLGLAALAPTLRANDIDLDILPALSETDLEKLGLSLGHRRKLLRAAADLPHLSSSSSKPSAEQATIRSIGASAERRQLTVMFCDLVGSTALSARLDPEDLREIIGEYHRCCAEQIITAGGFVAKYMGDGVLAYFGYPEAHEDDAERAVRSALSLVEAIPKLPSRHDAALNVRIGIATGLVVVGDLIGEGAAQEQGVVGDTPNVAARLQSLAEPGQIVISDSTRRLIGSMFEYRDLGRVTLKGLVDPVQAWQVLGASTVESRFEAQHGAALTPLIGREEELELLLRRWQRAKRGEGQVVLLSGEPGIGKSRLTVELQERLQDEPHTRLRYFCSPHHTGSAFYPTIAQLERAAKFERQDAPEAKLDKLVSLLGSSADRASDVQLLAELLSIPTCDRYAALSWSPQQKKEKTFEALIQQLDMLSRRRPVLMVYEDVHWIDPSSRELLDMEVERAARLPVLLLITFRPEFAPPWTGQAHVTTLTLTRLDRREGAALVERLVGNNPLPDEITTEIVERTDGVPLFVEELTKAVLEAGIRRDGSRAVSAAPLSALAVPATLHASLMARLDRLGTTAKEIAQIGAAIGREFSYELLVLVAQQNEEKMKASLRRLTDAGLVFCRGTPPQATFLFKHALVRDAAYASILRRSREALHARIAALLEREFAPLVQNAPETLGHHYAEAGNVTAAVHKFLEAGGRASARSSNKEAVAHLSQALGLLRKLPATSERDVVELRVLTALRSARHASEGYAAPLTIAAYNAERELAERVGDRAAQFRTLFGLYNIHYIGVKHAQALRYTEASLHLADEEGAEAWRCVAHRSQAAVLNVMGRFAEAQRHAQTAISLYRREAHAGLAVEFGHDLGVAALAHYALATWHLGYPQRSAEAVRQTIDLASAANHANTATYSYFFPTGLLAAIARNMPALDRSARELGELAQRHGLPQWSALSTVLRGCFLAGRGEAAEAVKIIENGLLACRKVGFEIYRPLFLGYLAKALLRAGDTEGALRTASEALRLAEGTGEHADEPELLRLRGRITVERSPTEGEKYLLRSIELAQRQCARLLELRASTSLARLWRDQGKRTEARDLLAPVYGWFTEGFDTLDLKEAKALLEELA